MKKKTPRLNEANTNVDLNDINAEAQRQRLLEALRKSPVSTAYAREFLNIFAPAPRVYELRWDFGFNIVTNWISYEDHNGCLHRIAEYILFPGKWNGGAANE
jgi:hypothetical protein